MTDLKKYVSQAKKMGMTDAVLISPADICFDIRANLKCAWGCDRGVTPSIKCDSRGTTLEERVQMVKQYRHILLLHSHDPKRLSEVILKLERAAFLNGYYFAFAMRGCKLCTECNAIKGGDCPHPEKVRPCESLFGIDMYKTVRKLGLPCEVLQNKTDEQNRYGFLLIE
jgi:predicted metal-binding protein